MRIILIPIFMLLSDSVLACSCGWGEYFYPVSKLEGEPVEPISFYKTNYGVKDLGEVETDSLTPEIKDTFGFMVVTLPIPEKLRGISFHFVLESEVSLEPAINNGFIDKAVFERQILSPKKEISEISTRMESKGNKWSLYIVAIDKNKNIVALAKHYGKDTCAKDVYVESVERAKQLDTQRKSGCYQTWGY